MNYKEEAEYRLRLARGFLKEAEQDFQLSRWRSCVDNAQLSAENSGKAIISLFEPVEKTHDPAMQLKRLIDEKIIPSELRTDLEEVLSFLGEWGFDKHILSDYGDEIAKRDPWELFSEEDANEALQTARICLSKAEKIYEAY
ncbi:MAG: HEPN domain-containing protein [Candidatus Edwardsbacteria bacterium]